MRTFLLIPLFLLAMGVGVWAQGGSDLPEKPEGKAFALGVGIHSHGLQLEGMYRWNLGAQDLFFSLGLSSFRSREDVKMESLYKDQGGKDYVYDKLNYCYLLTPVVGFSKEIIPQGTFNRMGLRVSVGAGPQLALLKPYYLGIAVPQTPTTAVVEVMAYDPAQHNYGNIFGQGDYFLGMDQMKLHPGARLKGSVTLDFSASPSYIRAFELGSFADFYPKPLPLHGIRANKQAFVGGYLTFWMGDSW